MNTVTAELLLRLSEQARLNPRLRKNHNFHRCDESRCHRLLNAMEPDSYIRPHRHLDPEKDEAFILMSGKLGVIIFSDSGDVAETVLLSREEGLFAADVPSGLFHTAVSLEPGTVFYEAKAGPYLALSDAEKALWAPADDNALAHEYLEQLKKLF